DLLPRPLGLLALGAAPNERLRDVESIGTEQDPAVHRLEAPPPCGEREHGEERQDRQVRKRLDGHRFPLDPKEVLAQVAPVRLRGLARVDGSRALAPLAPLAGLETPPPR